MKFLQENGKEYYQHVIDTFIAIYEYIHLKILGGSLLVIYEFFFDISYSQMMLSLFFLILFDLITGVAVAKKRGVPIESKKLAKTAFKLAIYSLLVSAMHLTDSILHLSSSAINLEIGMLAFLAATEGVSLLENAGRLGYAIPQRLLNTLTEFTNKK